MSTQHERDTETDFDYRGARFYDSDVARFNSLDPLAADYAAWSAYNYVLGNPLVYKDPDGRNPIKIIKYGGKAFKAWRKSRKAGKKFNFKDFLKEQGQELNEHRKTLFDSELDIEDLIAIVDILLDKSIVDNKMFRRSKRADKKATKKNRAKTESDEEAAENQFEGITKAREHQNKSKSGRSKKNKGSEWEGARKKPKSSRINSTKKSKERERNNNRNRTTDDDY